MSKKLLKHLFRDLIIWKLSFFGMARLYRAYVCRNNPAVRIVVFHDVPDPVWFESMIRTLTDSYAVISPEEFHNGTFHREKINILVTFDDGYASWVDVVLPILNKYNVCGIFFINSGLVDEAENEKSVQDFMEDRLLISPKRAIDWMGVNMLKVAGHTIGGHARTHANLTQLSVETLTKEIEDDKRVIEKQLGGTVTDFAYPFGTKQHVNDVVCKAVAAAAYVRAYTAITGFTHDAIGYRIPRMCVENGTTPTQLKRWAHGAYDLFVRLKSLMS